MPESITLTVPYPPNANNLKAIFTPPRGRARMITSKKGREYFKAVAALMLQLGSPSLGDAPVHMDIQVYRPDRRKRDLSNVRKALEDALVKAGVIADDDQIVSDSGSKRHPPDRANPRVVVTLTPIAGAERQASLAEVSHV